MPARNATPGDDPFGGFVVELSGMPPRWLCETSYARIGAFWSIKLVVLQRSTQRATLDELPIVWSPLFRTLDAIERRTHLLLLDSRAAPGQNDPAYETVFARYRHRLVEGWNRTAVLVQTTPGRLQLQRHQREGLNAEIFGDQPGALRWLLDPRATLR